MKAGNLTQRILVSAVGIPLLLWCTWQGGYYLTALVAAVALLAQKEYYDLQVQCGRRPFAEPGLLIGVLIVVLWQMRGMEALGWVIATSFLMLVFSGMASGRSQADVLATLGGICYPPLLGGAFLAVRNYGGGFTDEGRALAILLWAALWLTDTFAYAGGRWLGRHPLAPTISPGKTVEGFLFGLGGAVIAAAVGALVGWIDILNAVALALAAGLFGQYGDLVESQLKREAGVKDSGRLIPGHGGAFDRFDSFFAAAPILAMVLLVRTLTRL
ncbi:MAG: phosphatidate cytidylyltransferase [Calditrichaeota bacterium]|nr:phosphatidate cytidylyltransferase [Calditrichota bacterium]